MKKISVVFQDKDIRQALIDLGDAGVLHLEHQQIPKGEQLEALKEEHQRMRHALAALKQVSPRPEQEDCAHVKQMFINVFTSLEHIKELEEQIHEHQAEISRWQPWGSFDPREILMLKKRGIYTKLYAVPVEKLDELPDGLTVETVFVANGMARVIVFSREEIELDFDEVVLPECGTDQRFSLLDRAEHQVREMKMFVQGAAKYLDEFEARAKRIEARINYQQALAGRGVTEGFSVLTGYCPEDTCPVFEKKAKDEQWAYLIQDPSDEDNPPTLLRNPKWVELIKPVFSMANILPGYREVDVSVPFLFFFSIFFGMLIGDAGYGLIFVLITFLGQKKFGAGMKDRSPFILMYILSLMAIIWGVLTGTYFGQKWVASYLPAMAPWLTKNGNVQELCFFLGALQLSLAHVWRGILRLPSVSAGGQFGWALWVWGMFFLVRMLIVEIPMPFYAPGLMIGGAVLIFFCSAPNKNILKMILGGFGEFLGGSINSFTDIISYIRLFAVGLATVAMADAFNDIALGIGFGNIFTSFATALILFTGHALNILLASMAILVHGLRLNILEFSGHMNIQWSGVEYKPFSKGHMTQDT